jgi:peptidoglycan/LPS O-acetylase OafA/YrhL
MTISTLEQSKIAQNKVNRMLFLDGLRGIAILMVVFYHAFSERWHELLPYQTQYSEFIIFKFGDYGVQLFFIISGFVISMTLEKCTGFGDFIYRRWLRLFPAMVIASIIIMVTSPLFTARPYGMPHLTDVIPGVLFIEPEFFRAIFSSHQGILEGSFWTLFVEVKFYIVAGLIYFKLGHQKLILILVMMFLSSIVFEFTAPYLSESLSGQLKTLLHYLNYGYYGWFAAGALFYEYYNSKKIFYWYAGIFVGLIAARCLGGFASVSMLVASALVFIFAFSLLSLATQRVLSSKILVFIGFISYPFYLIHEQAMVSMINQLNQRYDWIPNLLLPILPILLIIFIAWVIARHLEPAFRAVIKKHFMLVPKYFQASHH